MSKKAYFFSDKTTRDILVEGYELESVSEIKTCDLIVLSSSGAICPSFLDTHKGKYVPNYNEEEDIAIRRLFTKAKILYKPVLAFGKCASLVHIFSGGKCYDAVDNHYGRKHKLWLYSTPQASYLGEFDEIPGVSINSFHQHCPDIIVRNPDRFHLLAATFVSTNKKKYHSNGTIDGRVLAPSRQKSYYTCDPEIYKWEYTGASALCFEFFLTEENFESIVSQMIVKHLGIDWNKKDTI